MQQGGEATECWECTFLCSLGNITRSHHALVACWQHKHQLQTDTHTQTSRHTHCLYTPDVDRINLINLTIKVLRYKSFFTEFSKYCKREGSERSWFYGWLWLFSGAASTVCIFQIKYVMKGQRNWPRSRRSSMFGQKNAALICPHFRACQHPLHGCNLLNVAFRLSVSNEYKLHEVDRTVKPLFWWSWQI